MSLPDPAIIKGPGLLYVQSRIAREDILDEETFFKWYDEDHIEEIIHKSGMDTAFRYKDLDFEAKRQRKEKPYLAFYPMDDLSFLMSDEFRDIRVKSPLLPDTGIIYDLAEMDVRYSGLVHKTARKKPEAGPARCLVVFGIEPGRDVVDAEVERWFVDEHIPAAESMKEHLRSTLYRVLYARTNAQSRALKGLPTTDAPAPEPPTWFAVHEVDEVVGMPVELEQTPGSGRVVGGAKQVERVVYQLVKALGAKRFLE